MCRYFCIGFIDFMVKAKNLLEYANLVFPNKYEKAINNTKISSKTKIIFCEKILQN